MTTNLITQEKISALVDGQYLDQELDSLLGELRLAENKSQWEIYHQIGDILSSDDLSIEMSADFSARLQARLDEGPIHLLPKRKPSFAVSPKTAYAVAAMFIFALIVVPRFAGQDGAETSAPYYAGQFSTVNAASNKTSQPKAELAALSDTQLRGAVSRPNQSSPSDPRMLRDPVLDSYLAAHQHHSNSMYGAADYDTTANAPEAGKK
ncbi:sigma-E factor negative regulatory protein [Sapientia aquatica]|uniref:Anti sigma-E protein RseA N-terminal domain-containing protein n=1 Tax=Sapientia aquatica TaxID=1549640 RepID=A0A4R5W5J4_9BURK|nr:sigma-E factor negative regulatory protein [Sapientia aquatica]TDK68401.1 hypothetical protein E2I14_02340 [Sapientia aquatica]